MVFDSRGNLVCIFYVVRDEVAALLVDGTWWGSRRLIGRDAVPGAAERFARALSRPNEHRKDRHDDPRAVTSAPAIEGGTG